MLDLNLIRSNPDFVKEALKKREYDVDFTELLAWDARRRELILENENAKAESNKKTRTPTYRLMLQRGRTQASRRAS